MDVISLGYRTDLALLRLGGSQVEDRGDHLVVRTPDNRAFWWGNFLLLDRVPTARHTDSWLDRFRREFPDAKHLAIGVDGSGNIADLAPFAERGLRCEALTVMRATAVREPARPNGDATYRQLISEDDWAQSIELRVTLNEDEEESVYREFTARRVATTRELIDAGHGAWFGAFLDGRLVAQMGLFAASPGLARFQSVETHPDFRNRGLAGSLVHHVSSFGFAQLGATTLVMVADPAYLAIRIYRALGFTDGGSQLQAERPPARDR